MSTVMTLISKKIPRIVFEESCSSRKRNHYVYGRVGWLELMRAHLIAAITLRNIRIA